MTHKDLVGKLVTHPRIRSKHRAAVLHVEDNGTAVVLDFETKNTLCIPVKELTLSEKNNDVDQYGYVGLETHVETPGRVLKHCRGFENIRRNLNKIQDTQSGVVSAVIDRAVDEFLIVFDGNQKFAQRMHRDCLDLPFLRQMRWKKETDEMIKKIERQRELEEERRDLEWKRAVEWLKIGEQTTRKDEREEEPDMGFSLF